MLFKSSFFHGDMSVAHRDLHGSRRSDQAAKKGSKTSKSNLILVDLIILILFSRFDRIYFVWGHHNIGDPDKLTDTEPSGRLPDSRITVSEDQFVTGLIVSP